MKAFVAICGLLAVASLAQDFFYEDSSLNLVQGDYSTSGNFLDFGTTANSTTATVVLNDHVYTLVEVFYKDMNNGELNSLLPKSFDNRNLVTAIIDVTAKTYTFIGVSGDSNVGHHFTPETLCTDGQFLYASVSRYNPESYSLVDPFFEGSTSALTAIYKFYPNLTVVDRVVSQERAVKLLSCTAGIDGSSLFLVKRSRVQRKML